MPYARCSECGQTIEVEKVSNDVMMMWHGTHCGSLRTYFADKDISPRTETARPLVSGQYQSHWRSQRRPRYLSLEPQSSVREIVGTSIRKASRSTPDTTLL